MEINIDIQDMGNDVSYLSVSAKSKEAGHVMVGRDHQDASVGRLIDLEVHPAVRRRGIGGILVTNAIRHLFDQGVRYVDVDVLSTNEPALALYDRLGFNETGRERDGKQVFIKMRRSTNI